MAQAQPENEPIQETQKARETNKKDDSGANSTFKFNVQAPEFVPTSHAQSQSQVPVSGFYYPCFPYVGGGGPGLGVGGSDLIYLGDQELYSLVSNSNAILPNYSSDSKKDVLNEDVKQKIIKQVEYQFSDMSLLANENLVKQINKEPEGFVPMSVVASTKKIKALNCGNHQIAQALQCSSKLVVSSDSKKVRRKHPFTDKNKEELQSRTVVVENLPDDHSHQSLVKIFGVAGSVKAIRICHPQQPNSSRPKGDFVISNKLHALVEYENTDMAEKAVNKLSDERNWRQGLRVRLMLRCSPKSVLKSGKSNFDGYFDNEDSPKELPEDFLQPNNSEGVIDSNAKECLAGSKKGWGRGRGKSRTRAQVHHERGLLDSPQLSCSTQSELTAKSTTKGPRMPDGTKGFAMGRGKPMNPPIVAGLHLE